VNQIIRVSALAGVILCSIALAGCAAPTPPVAPKYASQPVTDVAARVQALLPLDALLLGEQHDAPDHQRIHREVIETLAARGALAAVVLEMAMQGNSTAGLGSTSEDAVRTALKWDEQAWPWATYAPAIMAAVRAGVPVIGSNMPLAQMGAAMQQPSLDQRLSGPALTAQQKLIRSGHCNLLPESQISPMTRIQIARDVAMANAIAQAHASAANSSRTVVLLAGSGHVDRTLGVPQHLPPGLKSRSVLMVAGNASEAGERAADFDVVWSAAPVPPQDYCAGLKAKFKG
jgi:uncharacterized iron-regulated protein